MLYVNGKAEWKKLHNGYELHLINWKDDEKFLSDVRNILNIKIEDVGGNVFILPEISDSEKSAIEDRAVFGFITGMPSLD